MVLGAATTSAASAGSLGTLFVRLTADATGLIKGMTTSELAVSSSSAKIAKHLGTATKLVAGAFATMAGAAAGFTKAAINAADATTKQAQIAGQSVEKFSALTLAANLANVSQQELAQSSRFLTMWMEKNNIVSKDLTEAIIEQSDIFASMADGPEKLQLAYERFGRSGTHLIPLLNQGSVALRKQMEEARAFGAVIGPNFGKNAEQFNDNLKRIQTLFMGIFNVIASKLLPVWIEMQERFITWAKATEAHITTAETLLKVYESLAIVAKVLALGFLTIWQALKALTTIMAASYTFYFENFKLAVTTIIKLFGIWFTTIKSIAQALWELGGTAGQVGSVLVAVFKRDFAGAVAAAKGLGKGMSGAFMKIGTTITKGIQDASRVMMENSERALDLTVGLAEDTATDLDMIFSDWITIGDKLMKPVVVSAKSAREEISRSTSASISDIEKLNKIWESFGLPQRASFDPLTGQAFGVQDDTLEHQKRLAMLEELAAREIEVTGYLSDEKLRIIEAYNEKLKELQAAQQIIIIQSAQSMFDALGQAAAGFAGEQSAAYKAMFAASKAFAIAESIVKIQQGIASALSLGWPLGIVAAASVIAQAANIVSTIQSVNLAISGSRQFGGAVTAGQSFMVGESGPELFTPSQNGNIIPNNQLGEGGGGTKVIINNFTDVKPEVRERQDGEERVVEVILRRVKNEIGSEIRDGRGEVTRAIEGSFNVRRGNK